jgi:hypothetical protein
MVVEWLKKVARGGHFAFCILHFAFCILHSVFVFGTRPWQGSGLQERMQNAKCKMQNAKLKSRAMPAEPATVSRATY